MAISHDELDALRAESHAHRMDTHKEYETNRKKQAMFRWLMLGFTLALATLALFAVTSERWGGFAAFTAG